MERLPFTSELKRQFLQGALTYTIHTFRVPETLPENVLALMHAPAKPDYPIATPTTLTEYDGFLFGIPTRYGSMPAQFKVRTHGGLIKPAQDANYHSS